MQLEMECRIYCPCRIRPGRLRRHRQQQLPPQPRQPRVNDGSGRLMTVVLVLHMKARELRTPWLPMPESRKPCGVWVGGVWGACGVGGWVCVCVGGGGGAARGSNAGLHPHHHQHTLSELQRPQPRTWNGKWSGPRAGAALICTLPTASASDRAIAASTSRVNTQPCMHSDMAMAAMAAMVAMVAMQRQINAPRCSAKQPGEGFKGGIAAPAQPPPRSHTHAHAPAARGGWH